ncbi:MAG: biotin--[acetyl-CoA-carboxylase] ligase [Sphingomonas sp.]|nr:biotin--[acetyl-CoA-carboxylase] ligase [Sphingomonas sp.]
MLALADQVEEGFWLRAERQRAGRGRQGRAWVSPPGNFYGSTLVRLRASDPGAPGLALVAGLAVHEAVAGFLRSRGAEPAPPLKGEGDHREAMVEGYCPRIDGDTPPSRFARHLPLQGRSGEPPLRTAAALQLKWPNDLLLHGAKLAGILLERAGDAVVVGIGVNLAHHPQGLDRPVTSLGAHAPAPLPEDFARDLAARFGAWLARWRGEGLAAIAEAWAARAHPPGTALAVALPDGGRLEGRFEGLDRDGALILGLADGGRHVIHAGDVFLV